MGEDKVPQLKDGTVYADWKKRVAVWEASTKTEPKKRAPTLITCMKGRPEQVAIQLDLTKLSTDTGVEHLMTELDALFLPDNTQQVFNALDQFLNYRRPAGTSMEDYTREFTRLQKIAEQKRQKEDTAALFHDGVLGYFLLKNSNLDDNSLRLIRATVQELTFKNVEAALKRTFGEGSGSGLHTATVKSEPMTFKQEVYSSSTETDRSGYCSSRDPTQSSCTSSDETENERTYYAGGAGRGRFSYRTGGSSSHRGAFRGAQRGNPSFRGRGKQKDSYQKEKSSKKFVCFYCNEEGHKIADCPERKKDQSKQYFHSFVNVQNGETFLCHKSYNGALLDSGASATVCGEDWMNRFEKTVSGSIEEEPCHQVFRFGDGDPIICTTKKNLPINICGQDIKLWTFVVPSDVPLLLSRTTMAKMGCKIDFEKSKISVFGKTKNLTISDSGHMILQFEGETQFLESTAKETYAVNKEGKDPKKTAEHLHRYFAHSSAQKIKDVVKDSSVEKKKEICENLEKIEKSCDQCIKHKSKQIPSRKVALPAGTKFNERVAMDLKQLECGKLILHVIDTVTRYAMAIEVKSKESGEILTKLFRIWISVFGRPDQFLSDNGGEFVNQEFNEMCELFDITVSTSPAESPWCNGVIERHNGILGKMIDSTMEETGCNLETAICWCVNAKNTLCNVQGFSPNQLVFGSNPSTPGLLDDKLKLSTLNTETSSKLIADNINARSTAKQKYLQLENDSCIKKALTQRVFEGRNKTYTTGDCVYFKKEKSKVWHGPAFVVGQIGNVVIVKHGGLLYRVHPCKIVMKETADNTINRDAYSTDRGNQRDSAPTAAAESDSDVEANWETIESGDESDSQRDGYQSHQSVDLRQRLPGNQSQEGDQRLPGNQSQEGDQRLPGNQSQEGDQRLPENQSQVGDKRLPENQSQVGDKRLPENQSQVGDQRRAGNQSQAQPDSEERSNTWTTVESSSGKLKLKRDDVVRYRADPADDWTSGVIMGRAGKATGVHKNEFNIAVEEEENPVAVHLDRVDVEKQAAPAIYHLVTNAKVIKSDPAVIKAKEAEIQRFQEFGVFDEVKDQGQHAVSSRWVITSKAEGKYKARLVARGFQELCENQSDAPTASRISKRLLFSIAACQNWEVRTLDITSAFLQSDEIKREVYVKPPQDIRRRGIIWKLKKPLYGLEDSARLWYHTLRDRLIEIGCKISILDQSVFRYYDDKNNLIGMVVSHVDDLLYAGSTRFHQECIRQLLGKFKISRMHAKDFTYLGWTIGQKKGSIDIDQREYSSDIKAVEISRTSDKERTLTEQEKKAYQTTLGKLLWLSSQTRPDLSYDTMELSTYTNTAKVKHQMIMNKVVKKLQRGPRQIRYNAMDLQRGDIKVVFYSDASLGNLPNKVDSGRGYLVFISDGKNANLIAWAANKIKRTVHSVFGSETLGCVEAIAEAIYVRQILSEILYNDPRKTVIPIVGYIDSNQLAQQIRSTKQSTDKRMILDIAGIRQTVHSGEVEEINWIPTREMLADCLTKKNADSQSLKDVLERGRFL